MSQVSINPIYDEIVIGEIKALYSSLVTIPDHVKQLKDGLQHVPTHFEDYPIGISIVDDPIAFTCYTPCYTITCDLPSNLSLETLDDSLIDYLFGIDTHSHEHIDSPSTMATNIVPSYESTSSDIVSHDTSPPSLHTPSHYVDDPIDSVLSDILISESLSDIGETLDGHDSPYLHTIECDSPTPMIPSPEIVSSTTHESPPSITSSSPTVSSPLNSSPMSLGISSIEVSSSVISPIMDFFDASPTI
ncbi:hypothetical protein KI387_013031, partial [Taxus chinensis]